MCGPFRDQTRRAAEVAAKLQFTHGASNALMDDMHNKATL